MLRHEADAEHRLGAEARAQPLQQACRGLGVGVTPCPLEQRPVAQVERHGHAGAQPYRRRRRRQRQAREALAEQRQQVAGIAARSRQAEAEAGRRASAMGEFHHHATHPGGACAQECLERRQQPLERELDEAGRLALDGQFESLVETLRHDDATAWRRPAAEGLVEFVEECGAETTCKSVARQTQEVGDAVHTERHQALDDLVRPTQAAERKPSGECRQPVGCVDAKPGGGACEPGGCARCRCDGRHRLDPEAPQLVERAATQRLDAAEEPQAAAHLGKQAVRRFETHQWRELQAPACQAFEQGPFGKRAPLEQLEPRHQRERRIEPESGHDAELRRLCAAHDHHLRGSAALDDTGQVLRARHPGRLSLAQGHERQPRQGETEPQFPCRPCRHQRRGGQRAETTPDRRRRRRGRGRLEQVAGVGVGGHGMEAGVGGAAGGGSRDVSREP